MVAGRIIGRRCIADVVLIAQIFRDGVENFVNWLSLGYFKQASTRLIGMNYCCRHRAVSSLAGQDRGAARVDRLACLARCH